MGVEVGGSMYIQVVKRERSKGYELKYDGEPGWHGGFLEEKDYGLWLAVYWMKGEKYSHVFNGKKKALGFFKEREIMINA